MKSLSDEDFKKEIAPCKNHGIWIFGHLIACEDDFALFMGKGKIEYPEYQKLFGEGSKLLSIESYPSVCELKEIWKELVNRNKKIYEELNDNELNEPQTQIKVNDFWKTKEDIAVHWQHHVMYHAGQLALLIKK